MDTIINIQEIEVPVHQNAPFHELQELPAAKSTVSPPLPTATFTKPRIHPKGPSTAKKWCAAPALALVLGGVCLTVNFLSFTNTRRIDAKLGHVVVDPLDDLAHVFIAHGVESAGPDCLACFFGDTGRIRKSQSTSEASITYKSDDSITSFEVVAHTLNPPSDSTMFPIQFWAAEDDNLDGQPDSWQLLLPQYQSKGSALGWEKGTFTMDLMSAPFLKVTLCNPDSNDGESGQLQIGGIRLCSDPQAQANASPSDTKLSSGKPVAQEDTISILYQGMGGLLGVLPVLDDVTKAFQGMPEIPISTDGDRSQSLPSELSGAAPPPALTLIDFKEMVDGTLLEAETQQL